MPSGKVKWYDAEKGFGFLAQEGGEDVYVRSSALPDGVEALKPGQRVEFGMAAGRRGPQALTVTVLEPAPSVTKNTREAARKEVKRHSPDELHGMVADLITLLEGKVQPDLRKGRYPDRKTAQRISEVVRAVARELDS
ncbi:cold shock-like protein [Gordonia polyisoprenivorans VH2]|uniref:Cold shock-like protein n=2 Tax=Gordonia polyisoprenivorans TaxID=84595 RepID=H6MR81_GORPV|nr:MULTISPECIES: cold-shock protein [Gordonia]AFA74985.1 cold shock-like protein [Gordonia polyisoprenivorans VH2]MDF3282752.1 cold-shock protein [Gordonia sp. N1V]NKY03116.1 cold-shock protein [Gordonia polyisoprenivorans]OPX16444.1 cold-shock protein [Gordonia sp. i37]OZC34247.1 cold-shock protein [Gordonia polyisoprenivorans]